MGALHQSFGLEIVEVLADGDTGNAQCIRHLRNQYAPIAMDQAEQMVSALIDEHVASAFFVGFHIPILKSRIVAYHTCLSVRWARNYDGEQLTEWIQPFGTTGDSLPSIRIGCSAWGPVADYTGIA